jgi:flagellar protein FlaG
MLIDSVGIVIQAPIAPGESMSADPASAAVAPRAAAADEERLREIVRAASRAIAPLASSIEFSLDQESGKTVVKVIDTETQELIRQIPSPEMLEISPALDRIQGLLLKQKV